MCGVIMFTATGAGWSKKKAKRQVLIALMEEMTTFAKENGLDIGAISTNPEG